jgi:hypothetical protein
MNRLASWVLALAVAAATGCSIGAPPGFSGGDSWTFPLVGPLEDNVLIVPVFVNDAGPFLMAVDPDAPVSAVDEAIVSELKLHNGLGPKMLDESDTNRPSYLAEVRAFRLGPLTVRNRTVTVMKLGSYNVLGRQIRGVLGRDVIADSIVFGYDRERGVGFLATQSGFTPPAAATEISFITIANRLSVQFQPPSRKIGKFQIDGKEFAMHVDLGSTTSQLRRSLWDKAGLAKVPAQITTRDEVGSTYVAKEGGVANSVVAGALTASGILFGPYTDKRWEDEDLDGTIGLDVFRTVNVTANWDSQRFYLTPRGDAVATAAERIGRWGKPELTRCEHVGCVSIELIAPEPAQPAPPGSTAQATGAPGANGPPGAALPPEPPKPVLIVHRDAAAAGLDLEVLIADIKDGRPSALPMLVVNLPAGVDQVSNQLDPSYTSATFQALDLSPFPRICARANAGCLQAISVGQ